MRHGFIYEQKSFVVCVNNTNEPAKFDNMMDFLAQCKLAYSMLEAPVLHCEVIEKLWATTVHDSKNRSITFTLKGTNYTLTNDILSVCLRLPENNQLVSPIEKQIRYMLREINYDELDTNLGKIVIK